MDHFQCRPPSYSEGRVLYRFFESTARAVLKAFRMITQKFSVDME